MTSSRWDFFADASFIYWHPIQENMELGFLNNSASTATAGVGINASVIDMDFDWKPGFKLGLGMAFDHDQWDLHGEYTWFHSTQNKSLAASATQLILPTWGSAGGAEIGAVNADFGGFNRFASVSEAWTLRMDIADLDLGRWFYVGTKLICRPDIGLRAAWIRQNAKLIYTQPVTSASIGTEADIETIRQTTRSWGIGPSIGLASKWMVWREFRVFGNAEMDLLFTRYTKLSFKETHNPVAAALPYQLSDSPSALRTHTSLELGLGWNRSWNCNKWHTDVALGYEFQAFYNQNMFINLDDDVKLASNHLPNGDLYTQGLNVTFRLDF